MDKCEETFTQYRIGYEYMGEVLNYSDSVYRDFKTALTALKQDREHNRSKYDLVDSFLVEEIVIRKVIVE